MGVAEEGTRGWSTGLRLRACEHAIHDRRTSAMTRTQSSFNFTHARYIT